MSYGNFDTLTSIYDLQLELENLTPLSICSGKKGLGAVDNPIIKRNGVPYIPGSTLKGVLRSEAERYARNFWNVCDILNPKGTNGELNLKEKYKENYEPCVICRIFGGPTYASHFYIFDANPIDNNYSIGVRRMVSINRVLGGQHPGRLFDVEYVEPGCKWDAKMKLDNLDPLKSDKPEDELKVLKYVLTLLHNGQFSIGSKKSIGLGLIKAEIKKVTNITIINNKLQLRDVTKEFLNFLERDD
ncbi:MAG: CRISPR-associated RAMP protein Csx7 [Nitrososphaeria archaeon]